MLRNWLVRKERGNEAEAGFTLIEMSIVLVIIGLIIGGVLKGQELIASTRLKAMVSQWDSYKAAFGSFQDRYQALPGDFVGAVTDIRADSVEAGNGNGVIDTVDATPFAGTNNTTESLNFWAHLAAANMISGVTLSGGAAAQPAGTGGVPASRFAGASWMALTGTAGGITTVFARHQNGTAAAAGVLHGGQYAEIERKYDDSSGDSGAIMESGAATCTTAAGVLAPLARASDCIMLFQLQ